jgi:DNA polymerase I-like protein with 3'-5' exonuclease and polymerase domains
MNDCGRLLFVGSPEDKPFLSFLKPAVQGVATEVMLQPDPLLSQIELLCKAKGISGVICSNKNTLKRLLSWTDNRKDPSLDNYQGSLFHRGDLEIVILNPLFHLTAVSYAPFIFKRFVSKLVRRSSWLSTPEFHWNILTPANIEDAFETLSSAYAIATDIETFSAPLSIRCIGYTSINRGPSGFETNSYVLPVDSPWALAWMRKINWECRAPKIFQNGKYDNAYLSMYNAVPYNWLWDTATLFHCWYSELPKDLAFLNSFCTRESMYWKDLADTNDLHEYYRYNALDTWATANVWLAQMMEMPEYARQNYLMEFPLNFPCHLSEMTGIKRDMEELEKQGSKVDTEVASLTSSLQVMTATPGFNSNSPPQVKALMKCFGLGDVPSTDEIHLKKYALRHPINSRVINTILKLRKQRKLKSTYLTAGKEHHGRILYALNPHGTDTGRLASKEHHFWCGLQIQNIPRGDIVKSTIVCDDGFRLAECDLEQAESRDTAYAAGETTLIKAVESSRDFHSTNASAFFGVPYESIYDDLLKKTKDKPLRDLSKRVNHGANYLMGEDVLIDTMGEDKVWEAKRLLNLPANFGLRDVAHYLLEAFHRTYSILRAVYYPWVVNQVMTYKMLVSATGWTRYCFGNPQKNKLDKNAYVAHVSQNLNAMVLNKAYMRVFYEIAMHPQYSMHFKLCAQIHDSILFQFREGHSYLVDMVKSRMEIPVTIKGADGVVRTFVVPAAAKAGPDGKGAFRWSETE